MNHRAAAPAVDWVDRQPAAGRDFRSALAFLADVRARHLRGAHHTWGVALGLEIGVELAARPRTATVRPGLAYDQVGRELVVGRSRTVPIPVAASGRVTVCLTSDGRPPGALVGVAWAGRPLRPYRDVPLATVDLATGALDVERRPHVRTMAPPRVAGGHVPVGAAAGRGTTFSYTVVVDTAAAGFETAPSYLVQPALGATATRAPAAVLGPLLEVHDVHPARFSLTVRHLGANPIAAAAAAAMGRAVTTNLFAFDWYGHERPATAGVPVA